ncbi:hypothetical protein Vadar_021536 [Vaccinium darrowii]|uniref:Uncharacterized protein n=1 Tax=Vaccinium darrowii TaxID=229202 RepID=A0ACB7Y9E4_9ERIC|nr:hypothetical protein Vadar_021536 [Vaccinium darrowii]
MILLGSFQCFRCDDEICLIVLRIWLGGVAWSSSTELSAVSCSGRDSASPSSSSVGPRVRKASREYYGYFKMKPKLHYGEEDCHLSVSDSFPVDAELHFGIQMIDFSIPIDSNEI